MQQVLQSSPFIWREPWNQSLVDCMSCLKIVFKAIETFVDKARGRCICLWTLSRWGVLFKHEWASDNGEDNTRGLIITIESNNSVVGLDPSRGVILDLMKSSMYGLLGLLLIVIPFSAVLVGQVARVIPRCDIKLLWVIQTVTACVCQTITANFETTLDFYEFSSLLSWLCFVRLACEVEPTSI